MAKTLHNSDAQVARDDETIVAREIERAVEEIKELEYTVSDEVREGLKDRRRSKRKAAIWKSEIELENASIECESRNVSGTGALLKAYQLIETDLSVFVKFHVYHNGQNRQLRIYSRIVRVSFEHDIFNIAVHFEEKNSGDIEFLKEYSEGKT